MKTLIPIVDFVLHLHSMTTSELCAAYPKRFKIPVWNGSQDEMVKDMLAIEAIKWDMVKEYAKFLKQPLQLGMFVPCDEEGNVLRGKPLSPAPDSEWIRWENEEFEFYKATEKVLFEGFIYEKENPINQIVSKKLNVDIDTLKRSKNTVEFLVQFELTLTPTALKQIGL